jgi:TolA-binding protein
MGSIRVGVLAVAALWVAPGAWAAKAQKGSSFHTATAHQSARDARDERHGPAKWRLNLSPEKRGELADRKRDEVIADLQRIAAKFDDDSPQKPDLLFQLSEFYWEKHEYLYELEMARLDQQWAAFEAAKKKGEKGIEPKEDHKGSERYRQLTMGIYERLLAKYPEYARRDEVLFLLGYNFAELNRGKDAIAEYSELIQKHPGSPLVPDAYIQLGNYWFDHNKLEAARENYEQAYKSNQPKIHSYALYKLAWCDYNAGQFERALSRLQQVVEFADTRGNEMVDLKNEALKDLVTVYVRLDRSDEARGYFEKKAPAGQQMKLVARLADGVADAGHYDKAIHLYRYLIGRAPMGANAPDYQQAIVHCYEGLRDRASVKREAHQLADAYHPGSPWWKAQKDVSALRSAFDVSEEAMRSIVTEYHQEAQKTRQVETYKLARDIYKEYLDAFASSKDPQWIADQAFNLRFYYAEILWTLEDWANAAEQYDAVVRFQIPDRDTAKEVSNESYRKTAAYDAILAWDKLVKIERGELSETELKDGQKVDDRKAKGDVEKGVKLSQRNTNLDEEALTRNEQKLVEACDTYAKMFPGAKDEIEIRYQAAVVLYQKNHFLDAATRFKDIIRRWPEEKRSQEAAELAMHVLEAKGDWKDLHETAQEFLANKRLTKAGTDFAQRIEKVAEGSQYKYVSETLAGDQKDKQAAAEKFIQFVHDYPKSEDADRALTYATILFRDLGQAERAIAAGEQMLRDYPSSPLQPKVRWTLAHMYEHQADFKRAAETYESFVQSFDRAKDRLAQERKDGKKAAKKPAAEGEMKHGFTLEEKQQLLAEAEPWVPDAQFDAALWWEGLGKVDRALGDYRTYLSRFHDRKDVPEVAFHLGEMFEKAKRTAEARRAFEQFRQQYAHDKRATPTQLYLAEYHELKNTLALKNTHEAEQLRDELIWRHAKLPQQDRQDSASLDAFGHARFLAVEKTWTEYQQLKLDRVNSLQRDLMAKQKKLKELERGYTQVITTGAGEYGIAALTRLGQAYAQLAEAIRNSPTPRGLDDDQQAMYRGELEKLAQPLEDKAVDALQRGLDKAYELAVYNHWTIEAQDALNQYRPGLYQKVREVPYQGSEAFARADVLEGVKDAPVAARESAPEPPPSGEGK